MTTLEKLRKLAERRKKEAFEMCKASILEVARERSEKANNNDSDEARGNK